MKKLRSFEVTYISPTNSRGSRVRIYDFIKKESKIIDYDYTLNSIYEMAIQYLISKGIEIEFISESKKGFLIHSNEFKKSIK